jgi:hypothetical protein
MPTAIGFSIAKLKFRTPAENKYDATFSNFPWGEMYLNYEDFIFESRTCENS